MEKEKQIYFEQIRSYSSHLKEITTFTKIFKSLVKDTKNSFGKTFYLLINSLDEFSKKWDYCLYYYEKLEKININFRIPFAPWARLMDSHNLQKITFSERFTKIPYYFFRNCPNLEEVVFEGHLKDIGMSAFYKTPSLKRVVFKKNTKCEILSMLRYPFGRNFFEKKMVFPS